MSLLIIAIDNRRDIKYPTIYIASDKRLGRSDSFNIKDGFPDWKHVNDDEIKIEHLTENIVIGGGCNHKHSKMFIHSLKQSILFHSSMYSRKNLPSEVIKIAEQIDRSEFDKDGLDIPLHDPTIVGLWDDGRPFEWKARRDGSNDLRFFGEGRFSLTAEGGKKNTIHRLNTFIKYSLSKMKVEDVLTSAIKEASLWDEWISPTFDLIKIEIPRSYSQNLAFNNNLDEK